VPKVLLDKQVKLVLKDQQAAPQIQEQLAPQAQLVQQAQQVPKDQLA